MLEVPCHRCERHGRASLAQLIKEHGPDTGLPDLWESLAGDCQHARSTALHNRCAILLSAITGAVPGKHVNLAPAVNPLCSCLLFKSSVSLLAAAAAPLTSRR